MSLSIVGLDIAKNVFQAHGEDACGRILVQKRLPRTKVIAFFEKLALGAATIMRNARARPERATAWRKGILARRSMKVAVLAQAAKTARIAWAVLTSGVDYREASAARADA